MHRQNMLDAGMLSVAPLHTIRERSVAVVVPSEVTALELQELMLRREDRNDEAFGTVIERCYARIRRCASVQLQQCTFDVPPFVPGLPLYDIARCRDHVVYHLMGNGFTVSHNGGLVLTVGWAPRDPRSAAAMAGRARPGGGGFGQAPAPSARGPVPSTARTRPISDFRPPVRFM